MKGYFAILSLCGLNTLVVAEDNLGDEEDDNDDGDEDDNGDGDGDGGSDCGDDLVFPFVNWTFWHFDKRCTRHHKLGPFLHFLIFLLQFYSSYFENILWM